MNNYAASVVYGSIALAGMALRFHMTGDDFGVSLVATVAALAWASCYCTALYEQTGTKGFATAGVGLTGWALVVGLFVMARLVLP